MMKTVAFSNFRGLHDIEIPLSNFTLLTGTNGVGKTSVLEGLYCLFSETHLDVSQLIRYNRTLNITFNQTTGVSGIHNAYNYKLFWDECPTHGELSCTVTAKTKKGFKWSWVYERVNAAHIDEKLLRDARLMGFQIDSSVDVAIFEWSGADKNNDFNLIRGQILNTDGGLYLIPPENKSSSACRFIDFASIRAMPQELPYRRAKKLVEALKIINPNITDIRISKAENGLSVIMNDEREITLGALGNGVVTWASTLITILELVDMLNDANVAEIAKFILIDEIGAGIHYSVMVDIWKYIAGFVSAHPNIQFVATTHNDECVKAFCEVFRNGTEASIVRLHKSIDKKIIPTEYTSAYFDTIAEGAWEVKG